MRDLTTGPVRRHLIKLAALVLTNMVVYTAYVVVDLYWVSKIGTQAVAAVSISANLMLLTMAVAQVLDVGTVALVSHAVGKKDRPKAVLSFNQSQVVALAGSLMLAAAFFAGRFQFLSAFAADDETFRLGAQFLVWFIPAMALQLMVSSLCAALRGVGDMRPAVVAQVGGVLLNMLLSPILIFGWLTQRPLGITGAGLATFLSVTTAVVGLALYFRRTEGYLRWDRRLWRPQPRLWGELFRIGFPAGCEPAFMLLFMLTVYGIIREFGPDAQAGFGIGMRAISAGGLPAMALSAALAAVAGQNFGAGKTERVRQAFYAGSLYVVAWALIAAFCLHVGSEATMRFFSQDPRVVAVGGEFLRVVSWSLVASSLIAACAGMFQAMGNTLPSLAATGVRVVLITTIAVLIANRPGFRLEHLWWMSVLTIFVQMGLALALLRREFGRSLTPLETRPKVLSAGNARTSDLPLKP